MMITPTTPMPPPLFISTSRSVIGMAIEAIVSRRLRVDSSICWLSTGSTATPAYPSLSARASDPRSRRASDAMTLMQRQDLSSSPSRSAMVICPRE